MDIRRGIIRAFDSETYLANVQIMGSMATTLTGVPVAKQIGANLLTSGARCGVLFFDETNPSDACVVFVYQGTPLPWVTSALIKDGEIVQSDLASSLFSDLTSIFIPASAFYTVRGSPSRGDLGAGGWEDMSTWLFDDSLNEGVGTSLVVPTTGNIQFRCYYAMESATSGTVLLRRAALAIAEGEDTAAGGEAVNQAPTVPGTAKYLDVVGMGQIAVTAGDLLRLSIGRWGAHATLDTATGDMHFLGLEIRYV